MARIKPTYDIFLPKEQPTHHTWIYPLGECDAIIQMPIGNEIEALEATIEHLELIRNRMRRRRLERESRLANTQDLEPSGD